MKTIGCIYQNTKFKVHPPIEGVGDCTVCTPDPDNKNCRKYCEVQFRTFEVTQTEVTRPPQ